MMKHVLAVAAMAALVSAPVFAKLPAPPPLSDEQKVKAEEAKQRTAWQGKVGAYQQCQAEYAVVEKYVKAMKAQGKEAKVPEPAACTNPGPFQMTAAGTSPPPAPAATVPAAAAPAPAKK